MNVGEGTLSEREVTGRGPTEKGFWLAQKTSLADGDILAYKDGCGYSSPALGTADFSNAALH